MLRKIPIIIAIGLCTPIVTQYALGANGPADQLQQAEEFARNKQYDQAEQIYLAIAQQDIPEAFAAQKSLILLYITTNKLPEADSAYQQLITRFADHNELPEAVYQIGRRYEETNKDSKARELYEYTIEHFPDNTYAMWSLTGIAKYHIRDGNEPSADASVNKLLIQFSKEPGLPEQIHYVARKYEEYQKHDKALELYQYNIEHFPNNIFSMRSLVRIVGLHISDGNTPEANAAYDKLLNSFSDQPSLPREVYKIGNKFHDAGNSEKAREIYQYVIDRWTSDADIQSRRSVVMSYICLGNDMEVQTAFQELTKDFKNDPSLPLVLWQVAEAYYDGAFRYEKEGLEEKAREHFNKVIEMGKELIEKSANTPAVVEACYILGICYEQIGEHTQAVEYYQKVVNNYPDYKKADRALFRLGHAYRSLRKSGQLSPSEAYSKILKAYQDLITNYPDSEFADRAQKLLDAMRTLSTPNQ